MGAVRRGDHPSLVISMVFLKALCLVPVHRSLAVKAPLVSHHFEAHPFTLRIVRHASVADVACSPLVLATPASTAVVSRQHVVKPISTDR